MAAERTGSAAEVQCGNAGRGVPLLPAHGLSANIAPMHRTVTSTALLAAIALAVGGAASAGDPVPPPGPLTPQSRAQLARAVGNPDPGAGARVAAVLTAEQIEAAMIHGTRAERLVAIDAAAHLEDPWPILPFLAAFLGAEERAAASQAAASLLDALDALAARPGAMNEVVPGQAAQLARSLFATAKNDVLALDLRVAALAAVRALGEITRASFAPEDGLLESAQPPIASAAMALLSPPLRDAQLSSLATIAEGAADPMLRGQAVGALCENALAHKVSKPSDDLAALIRGVFDKGLPAPALLPALACIGRFPPEARAGLVDLALAHPDPAVKRFWDASSR
jgi:hypothetical protein